MAELRANNPVVVLTTCDQITGALRQALLPRVPLAFAESEEVLHQRVALGAQLVVLHLNGDATSRGVPGRLLRAVPHLAVPVLALSDVETLSDDGATRSELLDDVLLVKAERWQVLLQAWVTQPTHARQRTAELRVLHACAPVQLLPVFDLLMLAPEPSLSVKKWSADVGVSRTHIYRDLALTGMTPSEAVDAVRALHVVGPILMERAPQRQSSREWSALRTERRVLTRTLGMTQSEILAVGDPGSREVRNLVAVRLRWYFERARNRPSRTLPASSNFRT